MFTIRLAAALSALACAAPLIAPVAAQARAVPKGEYYCRYMDDSTLGIVTITGARAYKYNRAKSGAYRIKGSAITFTSGPMKGVYRYVKLVVKPDETYLLLSDTAEYGHTNTDATCLRKSS